MPKFQYNFKELPHIRGESSRNDDDEKSNTLYVTEAEHWRVSHRNCSVKLGGDGSDDTVGWTSL